MKTYSEFLRESTIVEGASIIRAGSRKKSTYRGPTGDHKRDEHGHIVASHYNKTKTEYPVASPKKGKGPIDWQKTKKNQKKKNKTIKAQLLANKKKKKESSYASQVGKYVPKTPEQRKDAARRMKNYEKLKAEIHSRSKTVSKKPEPQEKKKNSKSPRYKTTDYKNLRPASERMGKKKVNEDKKYPYGKATKKNPRGKRDQAELDRAQAYIKKNPNFGKKKLKEDAPTMSVGTGGFSGSADEKGPVAGYDPLLKMMNRWKKAKTYPNKMADVVNRGKNGR